MKEIPKIKMKFENKVFEIELGFDVHNTMEYLVNNQEYEPWTLKFAKDVLTKIDNPVIFDVGANVGLISIPLSGTFKKGKVYAFEAIPQCAEVLKNNMKRNKINNLTVIDKAVSSTPGNLELNLSSQLGATNVSQIQLGENTSPNIVESITLDNFVKLNKIDHIDLLKIDVEGWEEHVLLGAEESILKFKPCCIMEFNIDALDEAAEERGYSLWNKINNLFEKIFLIDRFDHNLFQINNYVELRSLMLNGFFVEDLLCLSKDSSYEKIQKYIKPHRYSCYGPALTIKQNNEIISFLSYYPDGWNHDRSLAVISGSKEDVKLDVECFWVPSNDEKENILMVYSSSDMSKWHISEKPTKINLLIKANSELYIWCSKSRKASLIFNNSDPRVIGFNMKILNISTDVGEN